MKTSDTNTTTTATEAHTAARQARPSSIGRPSETGGRAPTSLWGLVGMVAAAVLIFAVSVGAAIAVLMANDPAEREAGLGERSRAVEGDASPIGAEPAEAPESWADAVDELLAIPERSVVATAIGDAIPIYDSPLAAEPSRTLAHPTETGQPLVFLVRDAVDPSWLHVDLPVRPNGSTGWIRADQVRMSSHDFRIEVELNAFEFRLFRDGEVVLAFPIGVGTSDTPTPGGRFYVKELLQPPDPDTIYGPYAFGLSGFSNVLDDFAGGEGVIGIHGTNDPDAIGRNVSHGCIRLRNEDVTQLVGLVPLGTPVDILA